MDLAAAAAMVAGQPQHVDETGERRERELVQQHDADGQGGFSLRQVCFAVFIGERQGRGWRGDGHDAIIQVYVPRLQARFPEHRPRCACGT
ncbi:hypothetical protein WJ972_16645 [Achromobacter insuavis]